MGTELLLQTKLFVPTPLAGLVPRQRLLAQLSQGLSRKLILVSAPAGFGKTTLLAQWLARTEMTAAWLSLDKGDNDIARFLSYLIASLRKSGLALGQEAMARVRSGRAPAVEQVLGVLINELSALGEAGLLILDDYHVIENRILHGAVAYLLENQPPQLHLVISSRADPGFSLARLRAQGQLLELRESDLRFSLEEATTILQTGSGKTLPAGDVEVLWKRTEGWAAGLQLTALSLQQQDDAADFITAVTGRHGYIADFLKDEVFNRQPEATQRFLIETSILERLTGSLCDAVMNRAGGGHEMLRDLAARNLFLVPMDAERRWYRYHRLFADLLQQKLRQSQPDLVPTLHRRASEWCESHDLLEEAIEHALDAGAYERAADLLESVANTILMRSEIATLAGWVNRLPKQLLRSRPSLSTYLAWTMLLNGQPLELAESWLPDTATTGSDITPEALPFHAYVALVQDHHEQAYELSREALARLPRAESYLRSMATWLFIMADTREADVSERALALEEAVRQARTSDDVTLAVLALCNQAEVRHMQARLTEAQQLYDRALVLAVGPAGQPLPIAGPALNGLGEVARERNDLHTAERYFTQGLALNRQWSFMAAVDSYANLALLKQNLGDETAARQLLDEALTIAKGSDFTDIDDWLARLVQARIQVASGDLEGAWRWAMGCGFDRSVDRVEESPDHTLSDRKRKYERIAFARLLLAAGEPERALQQVNLALPPLKQRHRTRAVIEALALAARALLALGDEDAALTAITESLQLAQPGGLRRIFIDEGGEMAGLLGRLQMRRSEFDPQGDLESEYIEALLAALGPRPGAGSVEEAGRSERRMSADGLLTAREREVLALVAKGLTNQEIASRLVITLSTVKVHLRNIFGKLDAGNRAGAVNRARDLGEL